MHEHARRFEDIAGAMALLGIKVRAARKPWFVLI
jgi:hypothetical protein